MVALFFLPPLLQFDPTKRYMTGSKASIELLQAGDQDTLEFCVRYLSSAWKKSSEEIRARLLGYTAGGGKEFCLVAKVDSTPVGMMACYTRTSLKTELRSIRV